MLAESRDQQIESYFAEGAAGDDTGNIHLYHPMAVSSSDMLPRNGFFLYASVKHQINARNSIIEPQAKRHGEFSHLMNCCLSPDQVTGENLGVADHDKSLLGEMKAFMLGMIDT